MFASKSSKKAAKAVKEVNVAECWAEMEPIIRNVETVIRTQRGTITEEDFVNAYTLAYTACDTTEHCEELFQLQTDCCNRYLESCASTVVRCVQNSPVDNAMDAVDVFLRCYEDYKVVVNWHCKFFAFLDRLYVASLPALDSLHTHMWQAFTKVLLSNAFQRLLELVVATLDAECETSTTTLSSMQDVIRILRSTSEADSIVVVDTIVNSSKTSAEAAALAAQSTGTCAEYVHLVTRTLAKEAKKFNLLFCGEPALTERVLEVVKTCMIRSHTPYLVAFLQEVVPDYQTVASQHSLTALYALFDGAACLPDFAAGLKPYFLRMVTDAVALPVPQLIKCHMDLAGLVRGHFHDAIVCREALQGTFGVAVNQKEQCANDLLTFLDGVLRGQPLHGDMDLDAVLTESVDLFFYINEKDMFMEKYRDQLGKRLLTQRSASDEHERHVVGRVKFLCGASLTAKVEGMLTDFALAKENPLNHYKSPNATAFTSQMLTAGFWPMYPSLDLKLPPTMQAIYTDFNAVYKTQYPERRMQWVHDLGAATIKCTFGPKSYEAEMTTLQACVLSAFDTETFAPSTFEEVRATTNLPVEPLKRALFSLICGKFRLLRKINPVDKVATIRATESFAVNPKFTNAARKFRVPLPAADNSKAVIQKHVAEDRVFAIDAAIVRTMKARKILGHTDLMAEVLTHMKYFNPDARAIKKRIEALIERDYLERDTEATNRYKYVA
jgi:cullin 1